MRLRLLPVVLVALAFLTIPAAADNMPPATSKRVTLSGPGWNVTIDLAQFADPASPDNDTVAQVIGGLIQGYTHGGLLTRALTRPERRTAFDALHARFSQAAKGTGSTEPNTADRERLTGGDGNDVIFIGHGDLQKNIKGGAGHNLGVVVGDKSVTLNLAQAQLTVALGGPASDILIGGGRASVMIDAGPGDDIIIGGAANDMLSGGDGDDLADGGAGNDILRGGRGHDQLMGGAGDDRLFGGEGDDRLSGGNGNDVLSGDEGDDILDGGEGIDMAEYRGRLTDYRVFRLDAQSWRIADSRHGRDGSDTLREIERLNFADWSAVPLDRSTPVPVDDTIVLKERYAGLSYLGRLLTKAYLIRGAQLTANDLSLSGKNVALRDLMDMDGHDIAPETWAKVDGGQALLTSLGNVIFQPDGSLVAGFRYHVTDAGGNRGATAARAGKTTGVEMWASVRLLNAEPAKKAIDLRRECGESCTLDPSETELMLTGTHSIHGTGNDLSNILTGNGGMNVLDGGRGADIMRGGLGDDTYLVDDPGDRVIEMAHEGIDTVWSAVEDYTLPANVESLVLLPGVRTGHGNELDNLLRGNDLDNFLEGGLGNDMLDGGKGADRLTGGPGDDAYVVDNPGDEVIERSSEGRDTVMAEISFILPANVENLVLTGRSDIDGGGNELDNRISGNAGANALKGGAGNDLLDGGAGDDMLYGGPGNDIYYFQQGGGQDTIVEDDSTLDKQDTLNFVGFIRPEALWFWRQDDDLNVGLMNGKDWVTIRHWYRGPAHRIERIWAGISVLAPEGAEALVTAMRELAPAADGKGVTIDEIKQKLGSLLEQVWRKETKPIPVQSPHKSDNRQLHRQAP